MKGRDLYDLSDNNSPGEKNGWDGYNPRKKPKRVSQGETGQATDQKRKLQHNNDKKEASDATEKQINTHIIDIYVSKIFKCFHLYSAHLCVKLLYGDFYNLHQTVGRPIKTDLR